MFGGQPNVGGLSVPCLSDPCNPGTNISSEFFSVLCHLSLISQCNVLPSSPYSLSAPPDDLYCTTVILCFIEHHLLIFLVSLISHLHGEMTQLLLNPLKFKHILRNYVPGSCCVVGAPLWTGAPQCVRCSTYPLGTSQR